MTDEDRMNFLVASHTTRIEECDECFLLSKIESLQKDIRLFSRLVKELPPKYERVFQEHFWDLLA